MAAEAHRRHLDAWPRQDGSVGGHHQPQVSSLGEVTTEGSSAGGAERLVIDCDRCSVRGVGCPDCVVTVLLGGPPFGVELDETERRAIDVLAGAGLIPPLRMVAAMEGEPTDRG